MDVCLPGADADEDDDDDDESKSVLLMPEFAWLPVTMVMLSCAAFLTEL